MKVYMLGSEDLGSSPWDCCPLGFSLTDNPVTRTVKRTVGDTVDYAKATGTFVKDATAAVVTGSPSGVIDASTDYWDKAVDYWASSIPGRDYVLKTAKRIAKERLQGVLESFSQGFANIDALHSLMEKRLIFSPYQGGTSADDAFLRLVMQPEVATGRISSMLADVVSNNFPVVNVPSFLIEGGVQEVLNQLGLTSAVKSVLTPMVRPHTNRLPKTAAALGLARSTSGGSQVSTQSDISALYAKAVEELRPKVKPWVVSIIRSRGAMATDNSRTEELKQSVMAEVMQKQSELVFSVVRSVTAHIVASLRDTAIGLIAAKIVTQKIVPTQAAADYAGALAAVRSGMAAQAQAEARSAEVQRAAVAAAKAEAAAKTAAAAKAFAESRQAQAASTTYMSDAQKEALAAKKGSFNPLLLAPLAFLLA